MGYKARPSPQKKEQKEEMIAKEVHGPLTQHRVGLHSREKTKDRTGNTLFFIYIKEHYTVKDQPATVA